jgi:[mycofactocin precursor peptide]-tyrosine decarboxylase / 3-amino-5-[(4-hydroxyphenyl)methyl]-4,4-dimethylpyrrolidin-2-one synthase
VTRLPLVLVPQYFGSTVFDRRTSRYTPFDQPATDFLRSLCDSDATAVIDAGNSQSCGGILDFYQDFYRRGFFTVDGRFAGVALAANPPADHLLGPLALHLEVVAACNLKCVHCFAGELPRKEEPLTLNELDGLFSQMAAIGTFRLGLTGGEPLLRKDLFEVIDLALSHGLCPCVTTNGLLITDEIAREFGRRELVWLNVSLEGATAATNDPIRGGGTFDRVVERLRILHEHCRFTLAFTIMSTNLHEVRACARLAQELGAGTAVFRPLYPVGVARHHLDLMPTFRQYNDALLELESMRDDDLDLNHIDPFSPARRQEASANVCQNHGCGAGNTVCSVSVSGGVSPCSFLGPDSFTANVREHSLRDIWNHSHGFTGIRALPDAEPGDNAVFSGGCRARSLVLNGSVGAADPWVQNSSGTMRHPLEIVNLTVRGQRRETTCFEPSKERGTPRILASDEARR